MCTAHSASFSALLSPVSLLEKRKKQHISVHCNYVLPFRKDSLWDIAIKINNEQHDIKSSGRQPKERTILILGSKGVVSIVLIQPHKNGLHSTHTSLSLMLHQNHISANRTKIEGF
jgi:hypothetical protein